MELRIALATPLKLIEVKEQEVVFAGCVLDFSTVGRPPRLSSLDVTLELARNGVQVGDLLVGATSTTGTELRSARSIAQAADILKESQALRFKRHVLRPAGAIGEPQQPQQQAGSAMSQATSKASGGPPPPMKGAGKGGYPGIGTEVASNLAGASVTSKSAGFTAKVAPPAAPMQQPAAGVAFGKALAMPQPFNQQPPPVPPAASSAPAHAGSKAAAGAPPQSKAAADDQRTALDDVMPKAPLQAGFAPIRPVGAGPSIVGTGPACGSFVPVQGLNLPGASAGGAIPFKASAMPPPGAAAAPGGSTVPTPAPPMPNAFAPMAPMAGMEAAAAGDQLPPWRTTQVPMAAAPGQPMPTPGLPTAPPAGGGAADLPPWRRAGGDKPAQDLPFKASMPAPPPVPGQVGQQLMGIFASAEAAADAKSAGAPPRT